ncbi:MAG: ABC transporter permease [Alicyclobacillus sp.]|nr:ABC transporter permease [Alicyclobacillus sp.]
MSDLNARAIAQSGPVQSKSRKRSQRQREVLWIQAGRVVLLVLLLILWQYSDGHWLPDFILSSPAHVAERLVQELSGATMWQDIGVTAEELILGYVLGAVIGTVLGLVLGLNRIAWEICDPVISAINGIPKVALAPLFLIWMGLGIWSKVSIAAMMVSLLMFYNTITGIQVAPRSLVDVLRVMGANRWVITKKVLIPFLSTYFVSGLKSSVPMAVIGVVVGEFIASSNGVGYFIRSSTDMFDAAGLFAGIVVLVAMTLLLGFAVKLLELRLLRWQR